jgi:hypothetical protein
MVVEECRAPNNVLFDMLGSLFINGIVLYIDCVLMNRVFSHPSDQLRSCIWPDNFQTDGVGH